MKSPTLYKAAFDRRRVDYGSIHEEERVDSRCALTQSSALAAWHAICSWGRWKTRAVDRTGCEGVMSCVRPVAAMEASRMCGGGRWRTVQPVERSKERWRSPTVRLAPLLVVDGAGGREGGDGPNARLAPLLVVVGVGVDCAETRGLRREVMR